MLLCTLLCLRGIVKCIIYHILNNHCIMDISLILYAYKHICNTICRLHNTILKNIPKLLRGYHLTVLILNNCQFSNILSYYSTLTNKYQ